MRKLSTAFGVLAAVASQAAEPDVRTYADGFNQGRQACLAAAADKEPEVELPKHTQAFADQLLPRIEAQLGKMGYDDIEVTLVDAPRMKAEADTWVCAQPGKSALSDCRMETVTSWPTFNARGERNALDVRFSSGCVVPNVDRAFDLFPAAHRTALDTDPSSFDQMATFVVDRAMGADSCLVKED